MIRKWLLIFLVVLPATVFAGVDDDFRAAISLYDQGKFGESATSFQNIIDKGYSSPQLFYNSGCAYYKAGRIGLAIVNFRRAERLAPEDADIKANLEFARLYTVDKIEADQKVMYQSAIDNVLNVLSPNQYFLISLLALGAIFALLAFKRMGKVNIGSTTVVSLALVVVLSSASMVWVLKHNYLTEEGVVTVEQTEIMSGPGSDFELQFEAHEGLMFQILESRPDYYLALFANQLKGWVRRSDVVTI